MINMDKKEKKKLPLKKVLIRVIFVILSVIAIGLSLYVSGLTGYKIITKIISLM